ncbi:Nsa1 66S pre-ribosomal particle component [Candida orthopsilosis Co 90-125]|uniref:Ribosome biogenesis protein NSA1 n=1 Tax=Candida orthopsilosis (strain 90-125) TaxID=1136231 RepID=H8WZR0_CANO9|nr:Nsa1 66S pre-ribosomal particle component [Candida orthopsilosis Co 90-125]CCG22255.1 Nsa1 66S pre-ribosomal particle component [Candida orthopsilosis Co 90-125]
MKILVASDDTASGKLIECNRGTDTSKQDAPQPKSITNCFTVPKFNYSSRIKHLINYNYQYFIASRIDGTISVYDYEEDSNAKETLAEDEKDELDVMVNLFKHLHDYKVPIVASDKPIGLFKVEKLDSVLVPFTSGKVFLIYVGDFKFEPLEIKLPVESPIEAFAVNPEYENIVAYGGKEVDLKVVELYDEKINSSIFKKDYKKLFDPKVVFAAKNVKNDHLDLRVPIWNTNILFFKTDSKDNFKVLTSTHYGHLRIYDSTHGRKPLKNYQVSQDPISTLTFADDDQKEVIITGPNSLIARYSLTQVDEKAFKTNSASAGEIVKAVPKSLGRYTGGNTGATYAVEVVENMVAFSGLDRYLRVFDVESRELLAKVYLGVEVSSLVILDDEDEEEEEVKRKREAEEEEDEELWNQLDKKQKTST